ncbi:FAD/NAD(P)-binding protein [Corynebacterium accolens]|uniref:FAD/NAD(P)-binding protein n=1 Tax=Corynebacterium accolens TaxID=38284 RepID=UPI0025509A9C|nr:FAD/NAD(P)-binding protein [Corynebacterium accolens]MDK8505241.1 FAD/NAD(P)-binding protein [Corynebacterium accolens]MDK8661958.1 FAD/NAD(P)-binding protein [Corynebacterium accolens]
MVTPAIAIVGMGPRGISILERLTARMDDFSSPVTVHLIDEAQHGAGRVWDTAQTKTLCMNTRAGAVTLFTEPGATVNAPVLEGPTQYEWIQLLRGEGDKVAPAKRELFAQHPPAPRIATEYSAELTATRPESNPTRALYGEYLRWVYDVVLARLPESISTVNHHHRVETITADGAADILHLDDGSQVRADATVLAYGWMAPRFNDEEQRLAKSSLRWIAPGNPVEQDYEAIPASEDVLVRGLGMGFYDIMALTTIERGGRFVEDATTRSGLRYEASGKEPHFIVSSGRGYPFHPKSEYNELPPTMPRRRLHEVIGKLQGAEDIDFDAQVWPAIARDSYEAYITTLERVNPEALLRPREEILAVIDSTAPDDLGTALTPLVTQPWDMTELMYQVAGFTGDISALTAHIADSLASDIQEAAAGHDSPMKAALWSLSQSRKPASILGAEGRYTRESRRGRYAQFMSFGQMVGSGPPLFRVRQLLALIDAHLVHFLGDHPTLAIESDHFTLTSGPRSASAPTLVDAFMHKPDIRVAGDPLTRGLLEGGRVRPFADHGQDTGSPETDGATRRTVHPDGSLDERLHIVGIPTYAQWPDTTISPMPGTDPLMLQETDKTAGSLLKVAGGH